MPCFMRSFDIFLPSSISAFSSKEVSKSLNSSSSSFIGGPPATTEQNACQYGQCPCLKNIDVKRITHALKNEIPKPHDRKCKDKPDQRTEDDDEQHGSYQVNHSSP